MRLDNSDWPLFGWVDDIRPALFEARKAKRAVLIGTLTRVEGPSPRPVGSQMLFADSRAVGYFSGGCLEADVANHAQQILESGEPRRLIYGRGSPWIDIRLLCGGSIEIMLERVDADEQSVDALMHFSQARRPAWWISDGRSRIVSTEPKATEPGQYSVRYDPEWRLIIVGGDPIALAIASLGVAAGFRTALIRPDGPETPPPIDGLAYIRERAGPALEKLGIDQWTALVSATHDDSVDDETIIAALSESPSYVGVLGSAQRIAARRDRLLAAGLSAPKIASVHAPIGAARCGKAPWEVAVSVIAEIMQHRAHQSSTPSESSHFGGPAARRQTGGARLVDDTIAG